MAGNVAGAGASLAFAGLSGMVSGFGEKAGAEYEAARAKRAAAIGRLQATQIDSQMRDDLATTVSNIRAIRAATGINPDSPSTRAYIASQERVADRERRIRVGSAKLQAYQYDADAAYYKSVAKSAVFRNTFTSLAGRASSMDFNFGGG